MDRIDAPTRPLTVREQVDRMWISYPRLIVVHEVEWSAIWQGALRPLAQTYEVQISYCAFRFDPAHIEARRPQVEIGPPLLRARADANIPHTFPNRFSSSRPRLCLCLPDEWNVTMSIADTIVPWTVEWLVAYEGWRATGEWLAGGHKTERVVERAPLIGLR
jgi:hypothetical protein